jgi:hypothetical protein
MDLDEAFDRLYAAPLEEFTATRNALAKELGAEGARIKALKKPNLAAWALNQLARRYPDELEELFSVTERVRHAQRRVLSGGKATPLREATDERARLVKKLTNLAASILTESGHAAAQSTLSAITSSLIAIAAGEEGAELLKKGRLTRELRAESVVDVGGGLTLVQGEGDSEAPDEEVNRTGVIRAAREAVNEARDRAQATKRALRDAEAEVSRRTSEADEAERSAKAAREAAEFARRAVDARRAEAEEATTALEAAEEAFREADPG